MSALGRVVGGIRDGLMLDTHTYANPAFDGDASRDSRTRDRRLTLLVRSGRLRVKYRQALETVRWVCLFVGYPRSGHSLVGSLVDGHRHASIAHEFNVVGLLEKGGFSGRQLESLMLDHSVRSAEAGRVWTHGYDYTLEQSHQGEFQMPLLVIGDKKGGRTARLLADNPTMLRDINQTFGDRLKVVVHLRNPFDIVATMSKRRSGSDEVTWAAVQDFEQVTEGIAVAMSGMDGADLFLGHHHELQRDPSRYVRGLLEFLGLDVTLDFLEACGRLVDPLPKVRRFDCSWPSGTRDAVTGIIDSHGFLEGYSFTDVTPKKRG